MSIHKTELIAVKPEDRELLWNINQKYLYEMTNYYDDEMDTHGNLHYGYFDAYFTDPRRKAFLIYEGKALIGFMMIHPYSNIHKKPDHVMAEFTIFPVYRRKHLAVSAVEEAFRLYNGSWEIKYNERNTAAKTFWTTVTRKYHPRKIVLNESETVLSFNIAKE